MQTVFYHRAWRSRVLSSTKPSINRRMRNRRSAWKQNPVLVALKLQEQLEALPEQSHGALAQHVKVSRGRICQYLRLLELPKEIIEFMADEQNKNQTAQITERMLRSLLGTSRHRALKNFRSILRENTSYLSYNGEICSTQSSESV